MKLRGIKGIVAWLKLMRKGRLDRFLTDVSGVVHVGANTGQERKLYHKLGLKVLWIEPIPEVFAELEANLREYPDQRAIQSLVTDQDGGKYQFNVANNNGASSSIFELAQHKDIWPNVHFTTTLNLEGVTLASLFERGRIDGSAYDALVMDTQGSELLVLKGAGPVLGHINYIKTEVADFEAYAGCCLLADIQAFMELHGFAEIVRKKRASRPAGGSYYDIVFKRKAPRKP